MNRLLKWNFNRKFGIEYEFTNRSRSLDRLAEVTQEATNQPCEVHGYEHTNDNFNNWVCKTDSSCGIELVSPILHGPSALKKATNILPMLQSAGFTIGNSCGQHVHVEIADFTPEQVGTLAAYWFKIERLVLNGVPSHRRNNRYCQLLTQFNGNLEPDMTYSPDYILSNMVRGRNAINLGNWNNGCGTIEFRFGEMTFDSELIKNRVRFMIWLVEMCKILPPPQNLKWFSPKEAMSIFGLWEDPTSIIKYQYSPAVQSMRKWFLKQIVEYSPTAFENDVTRCRAMLEEINDIETVQTVEQET